MLTLQQREFSCIFLIDGTDLICRRIHRMKYTRYPDIDGFDAVIHIAVAVIVIYGQTENARVSSPVSPGNTSGTQQESTVYSVPLIEKRLFPSMG